MSPPSASRPITGQTSSVAGATGVPGADLGHRSSFLSTTLAGPQQRRTALAAAGVSAIAFAAAAPFAKLPLMPLSAFIPADEAALLLVDLITAVLLLGQFVQLRSAALLALASGYLFDGLMIVPHALTFPGLMSPGGWLGAGMHTTAWLYMFWHGGFPLFVIAYAGLRRRSGTPAAQSGLPIAVAVVLAVIGLAAALTLLVTRGHRLLPPLMAGDIDASGQKIAAGVVWTLTAAALAALLRSRPYRVLDLWLSVVMVAWLADIGLSAVFDAARYDLGFYAGRAYGLLAAGFVLAAILIETGGLHSRLASATAELAEHARDLDRRVRVRTAALADVNRQLGAILRSSPVAIFMVDPEAIVVRWTASAERLFGYGEAEALGRLPPHLIDEHMDDFRAGLQQAKSGSPGVLETRRRRKDGTVIDVSVRWARVDDEDGRLLGVMYAVADTTERKRLERQLQQAQKMEAVGTLTGGLAHDFNNHLGVIMLNLDVLRERLEDPEAAELAQEALDAATRGADLIRRLLAFARRQPLEPERTDVNRLITELTRLLSRTLGEQIEITLHLDPAVWPVVADPSQLEASLTNLATNARDAMPDGGELTIATGNRHLDDDYAAQHAEVAPGEYAMIEVSDSGTGIPPELLAQVFEPFVTTKPPGEGTGLGLSMVYGFIKQSGGHVNVYSEVGAGTTIRLYLPRADAGMPDERVAPPRQAVRGSGETVLAVEDNAALRRVVVRQLGDIGYRVLEAADARAALAILERERVAALFTDVVLPGGINGYELVDLALARWPDLRIVLTSGFPERRIEGDARRRNVQLLSKPYRREDVERVIGQLFS